MKPVYWLWSQQLTQELTDLVCFQEIFNMSIKGTCVISFIGHNRRRFVIDIRNTCPEHRHWSTQLHKRTAVSIRERHQLLCFHMICHRALTIHISKDITDWHTCRSAPLLQFLVPNRRTDRLATRRRLPVSIWLSLPVKSNSFNSDINPCITGRMKACALHSAQTNIQSWIHG